MSQECANGSLKRRIATLNEWELVCARTINADAKSFFIDTRMMVINQRNAICDGPTEDVGDVEPDVEADVEPAIRHPSSAQLVQYKGGINLFWAACKTADRASGLLQREFGNRACSKPYWKQVKDKWKKADQEFWEEQVQDLRREAATQRELLVLGGLAPIQQLPAPSEARRQPGIIALPIADGLVEEPEMDRELVLASHHETHTAALGLSGHSEDTLADESNTDVYALAYDKYCAARDAELNVEIACLVPANASASLNFRRTKLERHSSCLRHVIGGVAKARGTIPPKVCIALRQVTGLLALPVSSSRLPSRHWTSPAILLRTWQVSLLCYWKSRAPCCGAVPAFMHGGVPMPRTPDLQPLGVHAECYAKAHYRRPCHITCQSVGSQPVRDCDCGEARRHEHQSDWCGQIVIPLILDLGSLDLGAFNPRSCTSQQSFPGSRVLKSLDSSSDSVLIRAEPA